MSACEIPVKERVYKLEVFVGNGREWETLPGFERLGPFDANFYAGYLYRTGPMTRLIRESDGEVFCGRVPE